MKITLVMVTEAGRRLRGGGALPCVGNAKRCKDLINSLGPGAHAVRNSDAGVAISSQGQAGKFLAEGLDGLKAVEVSDAILGHGTLPFVNPGKERLGGETNDLLELGADDGEDLVLGEGQDLFIARSTEEAANEGAILGRAVGELVVHESSGEHALAFAAGHQKAEARRQRLAYCLVVAKGHGDRGAVVDPAKLMAEFGATHLE